MHQSYYLKKQAFFKNLSIIYWLQRFLHHINKATATGNNECSISWLKASCVHAFANIHGPNFFLLICRVPLLLYCCILIMQENKKNLLVTFYSLNPRFMINECIITFTPENDQQELVQWPAGEAVSTYCTILSDPQSLCCTQFWEESCSSWSEPQLLLFIPLGWTSVSVPVDRGSLQVEVPG